MGEYQLPETDDDIVAQFQSEYNAAFSSGTSEELYNARTRLIWAMVHSSSTKHIERGLNLATTTIDHSGPDREVEYMVAVALFKLRRFVEARRKLRELLEQHPDMHQALSLKSNTEDAIVKEGLMGVGIAAGVVGLGLAVLFGGRR